MSEFGAIRNNKCQICVGCGRCQSTVSDLHVITESFLKTELLSLRENGGKGSFVIADIGTTTIAMELYDETGRKLDTYVSVNPQRIFGADVISRIQAAENRMHAGQMQAAVKAVLEKGLMQFTENSLKKGLPVKNIYIAGNTTMQYLLLGHDVQSLGYAPFQADFLESEQLLLGEYRAITMPGLSAFVGGDIVAGILATGMHKREEISLLIDLGTNGEMVLGNCEKMLACSTAAGPAFEGMLQVKGQAVWGADLVRYAAHLLQCGIMDETGLLKEPYFTEGISIGGVQITQEYIRNLQTAKAAVAAGIQVLVGEYGLTDIKDINRVYLAGGFGYYLQEAAAIQIGLLPKRLQGKIQGIGNSALAGSYYYHFNSLAKKELEHIKLSVKSVNLAEIKTFAELFVENINFTL